MAKKKLEKVFGRFFNCYLEIDIYLNIIKYLNIAIHIFKNIKLSKRDKSLRK